MVHSRIEEEEIVERYVQRQLTPDDEHAFDEHLLVCDECFQKVQEAERFRAGMHDAAARGLLDEHAAAGASTPGAWLTWAFGATTLATAAIAAWMYFGEIPRLRGDLARNAAQLANEQQARADRTATAAAAPVDRPEANVPLVILQAARSGAEPPKAILTAASARLVVWIDIGPSHYRSFRLDLTTAQDRPIVSVDRLAQNEYGALVASLAADSLPAGDLRITLTGQDPPPASIVGEYRLTIQKP